MNHKKCESRLPSRWSKDSGPGAIVYVRNMSYETINQLDGKLTWFLEKVRFNLDRKINDLMNDYYLEEAERLNNLCKNISDSVDVYFKNLNNFVLSPL